MSESVKYRILIVHGTEPDLIAKHINLALGNDIPVSHIEWGYLRLIDIYELNTQDTGIIIEWEYIFDKKKLNVINLKQPDTWDLLKDQFDSYDERVAMFRKKKYTVVTHEILELIKESDLHNVY